MTGLTCTYGGPIQDADPLIIWASALVGRPVRLHVVESACDYWLSGKLLDVSILDDQALIAVPPVHLTLSQGNSTWRVPIDVELGGALSWDSPRHRALTVVCNDGRRFEIRDDRPVCRMDEVEERLGEALTEPDPSKRYERLAGIYQDTEALGQRVVDDGSRSRLVALSVFLEEYADPQSPHSVES